MMQKRKSLTYVFKCGFSVFSKLIGSFNECFYVARQTIRSFLKDAEMMD